MCRVHFLSNPGLGVTLCFALAFSSIAQAWPTVRITPIQDTTLYETPVDQPGNPLEMSNGAGNFLFAGRTALDAGFRLRRGLLQFDLQNSLPPGAEILAAFLTVYQSKAAPGSPPAEMALHRVLQAWGEGASKGIGAEGQGNFAEPGDATWFHRIYPDELWDAAGGSFIETPTATFTVGQTLQTYVWSCNDGLLQDLRYWQSNPSMNFGWLIKGGEFAGGSAHRFNSRENSVTENRPSLTLVYTLDNILFADGFEALVNCSLD